MSRGKTRLMSAQAMNINRVSSLGLRLVRILTEQLQGELAVNSNGRGTEFEIRFPMLERG